MFQFGADAADGQLLHVDWRLLMILRTIVEQKGLASAQAVLNMSQSSVSASLSELEDRLGLRLCNRGRSGFALTEAGRIVYEATHDLFDAVGRFSASAAAISDATRGILRIGAVDAVATNSQLPLASALRRFKSFAKNVLVDFLNAGLEDLETQVLQGKRDVVMGPYSERCATLSYVPLHRERHSEWPRLCLAALSPQLRHCACRTVGPPCRRRYHGGATDSDPVKYGDTPLAYAARF